MSLSRVLSIQPHVIRGGPAVLHLSFLEGLRRLGHDMHVVVPEGQELLRDYRAVAQSVTVLPSMPCVPRTTSARKLAAYSAQSASIATRIARRAREVGADVVHTFNEAFPAGGLGARLAGLPSVVHIIGMSIFQPPWVARVYVRLLGAVADRLVCCLQTVRDEFRRWGIASAKLDVVYNSVDSTSVRARADSVPPMTDAGTLRVGMVAGMDRRKGHLDFVAAAERVVRAVPSARFFIVGTTSGDDAFLGEIRSQVARLQLGDHLQLTGAVELTEPWMASFDVHCIPSLTEALSVAGLEAMALARPIVATNVGGNSELVDDEVTGLLCRVSDPDDAAAKILRLLRSPETRNRMGAAARQRADQLFSLDANVLRLSASFEQARAAFGKSAP